MSALVIAAPALPLHTAGKYVAGAYVVFLALLLVYVAIMAIRQQRNERELAQLRRELETRARGRSDDAEQPEPDLEPVGR